MNQSIVIAEDEKLSADLLEKIISEISDDAGTLDIKSICHSGEETINAVISQRPDILFLDINMPDGDGFSVVDAINTMEGKKPAIIFTTAHSRFAVRAFEVEAYDYLLKPLSNERVISALKKVSKSQGLEKVTKKEPFILKIPSKVGDELINILDVDAMEASGDYIYIYTDNRKLMMRGTLRDYSEKLSPEFFQTHRSFLVNLQSISAINRKSSKAHLILKNGDNIPLSRRYKSALLKVLPHII